MPFLQFFTGIFRRCRAFILRREVEVVGQCKSCGECCKGILLNDRKRWIKKERHFRQLCEKEPEHERFVVTERSEEGHLVFNCSKQGKDNFCTCYEDRLPLCRNYPSKSIYYQGGWIRPGCGYSFKAFKFRDVFMRRKRGRIPKFADVLQQELKQSDNKEQAS